MKFSFGDGRTDGQTDSGTSAGVELRFAAKNKFILCNLVEKCLSPPIKAQLYFGIQWGETYN